jgi:gamma-tubulin complex component 2
MIKIWSTAGHLRDPYDELMVKETKSINRGTLEMDFIDEYWEKRYTVSVRSRLSSLILKRIQLRDGTTIAGTGKRPQAGVPALRTVTGRLPGGACIPPLLEGWKHKILLSGKYLNVIRECGIDIPQVAAEDDEEWVLDGEKSVRGTPGKY